MNARTFVILGALVAVAAPVRAQERTDAISISPVLALFEVYQGEFEHAVSPEWTVALGGSHFSTENDVYVDATGEYRQEDWSYNSADLKARFYPSGEPFDGFSFGASVGWSRIGSPSDHANAFTYGVELGHGWLMGSEKHWYFGLGIGAKRYQTGEDSLDGGDLPTVLPTGRLNFGYAF